MSFPLTSSALEAEETIPDKYTCEGKNISPPLSWQGVPEDAQSLALVCEDPDAPSGIFTHWLLYNIPTTRYDLPENVPPHITLDWGGAQGRNDFGDVGYGGPCPPRGETHRYYFRLYALDQELDLSPGLTRDQFFSAVEGHVLDRGDLMGRYRRS
ncbi:MAG: YbhB/YbcL family Raf kinase inhibitor-like protein [Anaerolineae bacterium]